MKYTGKIISLAFPDTFVKLSDETFVKFLSYVGIGTSQYIKAGHAAFVLIDNQTGRAEYFDFGRYITPKGKGRVRSAITDVELEMGIQASFAEDGKLSNVEEFLLWLEASPEKTHGEGRLIASVCDYIYYDKVKSFILGMQEKRSVPYKAFGKHGSNCSRIVTDAILAGTDHPVIRKGLLWNKKFTPSPLGNVEKSSLENPIYETIDGVVKRYSGSIFKENLKNYFDKKVPVGNSSDNECERIDDADFLEGIGSSAYFKLENSEKEQHYVISRYTESGILDFKGVFKEKKGRFDSCIPFSFQYESNCKECYVKQNETVFVFDLVARIS
ncbi:DUF6695 family protein [Aquimarina hainanensis]|uniref:DUF6695 family protein n=1 Tax=Aquimarina hainanensis TaxID=1578017 RepID=A0ABW5NA77_9FLAO